MECLFIALFMLMVIMDCVISMIFMVYLKLVAAIIDFRVRQHQHWADVMSLLSNFELHDVGTRLGGIFDWFHYHQLSSCMISATG